MKLHTVQYLRGAAAVAVLVAHAFNLPLAREDLDLVRLGRFGVVMFFVISGFIMVLVAGPGRFDPRAFLRRRIVRIVPLYWLATLAVAALALVAPQLLGTAALTLPHLVLSLLFVPHVAPGGAVVPLLWLGWTLVYEMFFYACFALLFMLSAGRRIVLLTVGFATLAGAGAVLHPTNAIAATWTAPVILAFCVGGWIGLAALRGRMFGGTPRQAIATAGVAALATALAFAIDRGTRGAEAVTAAMTLASAAWLLLAVAWDARLRPSPALSAVGDASYSLYLSHGYVLAAVGVVARRLFAIPSAGGGYAVTVAAGIVAGIAGGLILYRLVERPLLRRLHRA